MLVQLERALVLPPDVHPLEIVQISCRSPGLAVPDLVAAVAEERVILLAVSVRLLLALAAHLPSEVLSGNLLLAQGLLQGGPRAESEGDAVGGRQMGAVVDQVLLAVVGILLSVGREEHTVVVSREPDVLIVVFRGLRGLVIEGFAYVNLVQERSEEHSLNSSHFLLSRMPSSA